MVKGPHAPLHILAPKTGYMVTAATYRAIEYFRSDDRLEKLETCLLEPSRRYSWLLHAWVIVPNHYHFIGTSPDDPSTLASVIRGVHSITVKYVNTLDGKAGRRVWHNYWDTCISTRQQLPERMKYVHLNPVKHGLVSDPMKYPYCGFRHILHVAPSASIEEVQSRQIDHVRVSDHY